jgi:hypothetical protein
MGKQAFYMGLSLGCLWATVCDLLYSGLTHFTWCYFVHALTHVFFLYSNWKNYSSESHNLFWLLFVWNVGCHDEPSSVEDCNWMAELSDSGGVCRVAQSWKSEILEVTEENCYASCNINTQMPAHLSAVSVDASNCPHVCMLICTPTWFSLVVLNFVPDKSCEPKCVREF